MSLKEESSNVEIDNIIDENNNIIIINKNINNIDKNNYCINDM